MKEIGKMDLIRKIMAGDNLRPSRLQDEKGNLITLAGAINLPRVLATYVAYRVFDYRPELPWLGYAAIARLQPMIQHQSRVVEFGSGMSTLWLAKRCGFLYSIESDAAWFRQIAARLEIAGLRNIQYELRSPETFSDLSEVDDASLDFALIDGIVRSQCVQSVLTKVKPGGHIYLDNTDKDMILSNGDMRIAEKLLTEAVCARQGTVEYFTDFAPTLSAPTQGMLARV